MRQPGENSSSGQASQVKIEDKKEKENKERERERKRKKEERITRGGGAKRDRVLWRGFWLTGDSTGRSLWLKGRIQRLGCAAGVLECCEDLLDQTDANHGREPAGDAVDIRPENPDGR